MAHQNKDIVPINDWMVLERTGAYSVSINTNEGSFNMSIKDALDLHYALSISLRCKICNETLEHTCDIPEPF